MTKKEKAKALAARSECEKAGVTMTDILRFAETREIHGYYKGIFKPSIGRRPTNLWALLSLVKERKLAKAEGRPPRPRRARQLPFSFPRRF